MSADSHYYILCPSEMADESLFDFLHMEIVSHVYKPSSKGEMDNKVSETIRANIYRPWRV